MVDCFVSRLALGWNLVNFDFDFFFKRGMILVLIFPHSDSAVTDSMYTNFGSFYPDIIWTRT